MTRRMPDTTGCQVELASARPPRGRQTNQPSRGLRPTPVHRRHPPLGLLMSVVLLSARLLLAAVFLVAAVAKLADREGSRRAARQFGVPAPLSSLIGALLPLAELTVAGALIADPTARWGAAGALVLLTLFITALVIALSRGRRPDCHCFGQLHAAPAGRATLVRNVVLAGVAGFALLAAWGNPGASPTGWLDQLSAGALVGVSVGVVLLALQAWFSYQLLRQHGRLLLRIEQLEALRSATAQSGLTPGAVAPEFSLSTADDRQVSLSTLLAAGSRVLLVFSDPGCPACAGMAADFAGWQAEHSGSLRLAMISRETDAQSPRDALLDHERVVARAYAVTGTPAAVLVDADGRIASRPAIGPKAIASLVDEATRPASETPRSRRPSPNSAVPIQVETDGWPEPVDAQPSVTGVREPVAENAI